MLDNSLVLLDVAPSQSKAANASEDHLVKEEIY
jgi:hypothetical protein